MRPIQFGVYEHYKGKRYNIIGVAKHSETLEDLVLYQALYMSEEFGNNAMWVRPLAMFFENVDVDGQQVPRFRYVGDKNGQE